MISKQRRLELGLTQTKLAEILGVNQTYITYIEKNQRTPSNDILRNLTHALKLPFERLYVLAHPDIQNMLKTNKPVFQEELPYHLKALATDQVLREKFSITDQDISMLGSIHARGQIEKKEDYITLLMTIRNIFKK